MGRFLSTIGMESYNLAIRMSCNFVYSDGYLYGYPNYRRAPALIGESLAKQPHVVAPCNNCVPAEIAPQQKAIGNCPKTT